MEHQNALGPNFDISQFDFSALDVSLERQAEISVDILIVLLVFCSISAHLA